MNEIIKTYKSNKTDKNFNIIFKQYKNLIDSWCNKMYGKREYLDDLQCEVYSKLPHLIDIFDCSLNIQFSTFLVQCIINYYKSRFYRKYYKQSNLTYHYNDMITLQNNMEGINDETNLTDIFLYKHMIPVDEITSNDEIVDIIEDCKKVLSPKEIKIFDLQYYNMLSIDEIATMLNSNYRMVANVNISIYRKMRPKLLKYKIINDNYIRDDK